MPAKIIIACRYYDCQHNENMRCTLGEIELDPKKFCLSFLPIVAQVEEETDIDDLEDDENLVGWEDLEEEDEDDEDAYGDEE